MIPQVPSPEWFATNGCEAAKDYVARHQGLTVREHIEASIAEGHPDWAVWLVMKLLPESQQRQAFAGFMEIAQAAGFPGKASDLGNFIAGRIMPTDTVAIREWLDRCLKEDETCPPQA